jgi:hypothetical protein
MEKMVNDEAIAGLGRLGSAITPQMAMREPGPTNCGPAPDPSVNFWRKRGVFTNS